MNGPDPVFIALFLIADVAILIVIATIRYKIKERNNILRAERQAQIIADAIRQHDLNQPRY